MLRSRLFMLMLAALLIAQSALGMALHRCHDGAADAPAREMMAASAHTTMKHCHDDTAAKTTPAAASNNLTDHGAAPHGICTCAIAHCAPALISQFELTSIPTHPHAAPLYRFSILNAPAETLLRPPIVLS